MSFLEDKIGFKELTFDDGLLIPSYSELLLRNVDALRINTMLGCTQSGLEILKTINAKYPKKDILAIQENHPLVVSISREVPNFSSYQ